MPIARLVLPFSPLAALETFVPDCTHLLASPAIPSDKDRFLLTRFIYSRERNRLRGARLVFSAGCRGTIGILHGLSINANGSIHRGGSDCKSESLPLLDRLQARDSDLSLLPDRAVTGILWAERGRSFNELVGET